MSSELPTTQRAVRWYPPSHDIRVEEVPVPIIQDPDDAIIKVKLGGLCGSDLHIYRGHSAIHSPIVCGHEFIGEVSALGSNFSPNTTDRPLLYSTLRIGDKVVAPFTVSCGECHFCRIGFSSRCAHSVLFGVPSLPGGQAQYVRVPKAGGTLFKVESILSLVPPSFHYEPPNQPQKLSDSSLLLLADILPTGAFAAIQALQHPKLAPFISGRPFPFNGVYVPSVGAEGEGGLIHSGGLNDQERVITIGIVGLGPVGLCAIVALLDMLSDITQQQSSPTSTLNSNSSGLKARVVAIDLNEFRQKKAKKVFEAISKAEGTNLDGIEFVVAGVEEGKEVVKKWTDSLGCNVVLEVVGSPPSLSLCYDLIRPFGVITSVGVHSSLPLPFAGSQVYDKNVSLDFGRCPVRSVLPIAAALLVKRQDIFGGVGGEGLEGEVGVNLIEKIVGLDEAVEAYDKFDKGLVGKVLFDPWI